MKWDNGPTAGRARLAMSLKFDNVSGKIDIGPTSLCCLEMSLWCQMIDGTKSLTGLHSCKTMAYCPCGVLCYTARRLSCNDTSLLCRCPSNYRRSQRWRDSDIQLMLVMPVSASLSVRLLGSIVFKDENTPLLMSVSSLPRSSG